MQDNSNLGQLNNNMMQNFYTKSEIYTRSQIDGKVNVKLNKSISGNQQTRCIQDLLNVKIITADAQGASAVSNLDGYLVFHIAVDIRDAQQYYLHSVGLINNNQYFGTLTSYRNLTMATNKFGTVSIQGGIASYIKQVFICIPQINAAIVS